MTIKQARRTKYEDFPIRFFFRLLSKPDGVAERFMGPKRWFDLKQRWEEDDDSMEKDRLLEDQQRAGIPKIKAEKALLALKYYVVACDRAKDLFHEVNLPWDDNPNEMVEKLKNYIEKQRSQYENNLIQLEATKKQAEERASLSENKFSIDDAIATLNYAGFTINDPNSLTIGEFKAMNKTIERNGKRKD